MKWKSEVLAATKQFAKDVGTPDAIVCDMASKQLSSDVKQFCNAMGTTLRALEEGTPWSNKAKLYIKLMKEVVRKDMREEDAIVCDMASKQLSSGVKQFCNAMETMLRALEEGTPWLNKAELYIKPMKEVVRKGMREEDLPLPFGDYCLERRVWIYILTQGSYQDQGDDAHTATTHEEGDISNLCQYKWCDWCYYREHTAKFPHNQEVLGHVLGPARGKGNEMTQWVLKANGNVVLRCSL